MNIYKRELKSELKSILYWIFGVGFLLVPSMITFPMMDQSGVDITDFMDSMPRILMILFGMNDLDMSTATGYHGILLFYVLIAGAVYASMLGVRLVSKEELLKTSEFLLTKPRTRKAILAAKTLAGITLITVFTVMTYIFSVAGFLLIDETSGYHEVLIIEALSLLILMLLFFFCGLLFASLFKKTKLSSSVTLSVVFGTFLISVFYDLLNSPEVLRILTPFRYFPLVDIVENNELSSVYLMLSLIFILFMAVLAAVKYEHRDMDV